MKHICLLFIILIFAIKNSDAQFNVDASGAANILCSNATQKYKSALDVNVSWPYTLAFSIHYWGKMPVYILPQGIIVVKGGIFNWSDSNFKTNIAPIDSALEKVLSLNGVAYNFKSDTTFDPDTNRLRYGFITQEFENIFPNLVLTTPDSVKAISYQDLIAVTIEAIKEQQNQIEALKQQVNNCCIVPVLSTFLVSNVTVNSASTGGDISNDGGASITSRGVCWSTTQPPTTSDNITTNGTGKGSFTSDITSFLPNTTYYIRAYATTNKGTGYGNIVSFYYNQQ